MFLPCFQVSSLSLLRKGEILFYVAEVDVQKSTVSVGIRSFPAQNPPFALQDADFAVARLQRQRLDFVHWLLPAKTVVAVEQQREIRVQKHKPTSELRS